MNNKKCFFKVCLFLIAFIVAFGIPGGVHAAMNEAGATTLRQTDSLGRAVTDDGTYIYTVIQSSPTRVIKVRMSDMEEVGALTLAAGENYGFGITNDGTYLYIVTNTSPARVVKVEMSSMTRVGAVRFADNADKNGNAITNDGTHLYVVTNTNPTRVIKVQMSDLSIKGTLGLSGHSSGRAVVNDGEYLYVVNYTSPTTVVKVKMSDLTIPSINGALKLNTEEDLGVAVTRDSTYLYVVNYSQSDNESRVTKVQMSDMSRVQTVTLTGVIHAHAITCDNTYLYIPTLTSPINIAKVRIDNMELEGASYSVDVGGASYYGATSVTSDNEHLYMVTYSSSEPVKVIKLRKSDMAQTGILILGEKQGSAVTDDGTYLYVINNMAPTIVTKVRMSDNKRMGSLALNPGENNGKAVTNDGTHLYVVNNSSPTIVTKVRMDDMKRVGAVTLEQNNGNAVTNDGTHLYVVNNTTPTTLTKVRMNDLEKVGTLTLNAGENNGIAVTNDGTHLYVINNMAPTKVTKVQMSSLTRVGAVNLEQINGSAITNDRTYLYVVNYTAPTKVTKVRMDNLAEAGAITLDTGENYGKAVTNDGAHLYVVNYTTPTKVTSVRKSDLVITGAITLSSGSNKGSAITKDASYLYVVTDTLPTKVVRISYEGVPSVTGIAVEAQPAKLTYTAGETLDLAGLVATLSYDNGTTADIAYAQFGANSITTDPANGTELSVSVHNNSIITLACNNYTATTASLTVNPAALTGTATITGDAIFGQTLTASLTGGNNTGTLSYQWTRNDGDIGGATDFAYTLIEDDIGKLISVKITSSVQTGTLTSDPTATVEKADCATATGVTPALSSKTTTSITVVAVAGYEYILVADGAAVNTGTWQDSNEFTGLAANTAYDICQRVKETATHKASNVSAKLDATTDAIPTYTASISPTSQTFTAATEGYGQQAAREFTIENTGAGTITNLSAQLGGTDFEISTALSALTINAASTATVSVRPRTGLLPNTYTDILTITGSNGISMTADLSFTVTEQPSVTAIAVKMQPTKLTYTAGETLDLSGMIATLTYSDGSIVDVAYAQFGANGITANPEQGTIMEVAIHNGQAIILTCNTHNTTTTGNLTVNAAPTYSITLSETGTHTFTALTVGYTPVAPITVTVSKTGTGNITNLSAALSGTDADDFTLGALDAATLDSTTTSAVFTMKPDDALAPGTYNATVTVTADNGVNQSFNICFTVNAPSAPTIQSAAAGDTHVNITWSSVPGATGYKIYQSTVSGSYGAALATVSDSVYNYDAAGLSNGTTYFFVVRASIGIYDSVNSNEVSSTPQVPAPGAPVLQTAVAGDGHVNLTWSEVEGSIGYKIYASTTSGSYTSPADTVPGSVNSCDVTGLTNGAAYYFVVTASNPGGDSGYSNEISATPQVSAPSAPTGLTATGENGKVTLSWNSTAEAAGYKIYQSESSGFYGAALTTVAESVYSYEITGLTNGVVYYFVIKATNAGGDSPYSAEVTATPATVPGAPTNVAATAGNGQVTVSFTPPADNGGSTITGYTVTSNPGNLTAAGTATTITVTGLSNGTAYTFTVTASNAAGTGPASATSNAATPYRHSSGGSTPSTTPEQPADNGIDILVNGKTEKAATVSTTQEGDKTVTTVVVDDKKVEERLEQEGNNAVVTIPVNNGADVVVGSLNGQTVKNMESKDAVLEIKTGQVTYTLPASQINIDAVSGQIGKQVELKDIAVSVKISEPAEDTVKIVEDTADKNNYQIIVKPIEFEITCSSGSKTVEVSKFSAYVERMIAIPEGVDPSKITTGVILNSDGTFSHVPTVITMIDGKYYAKINSLTNSAYLLIYSPKTFQDVGKHWAEKNVNDLASRLVVSGIGDDKFEPDRDITRAEFTAIVVRALGLMSSGTGKDAFIDVMKKNWYYDAVSIAYEYDIISGYGNGKFRPDDKITREQAMTMIARAMKITGLETGMADGEADKLLTSFTDANSAAEYAKANIASCVKAGIVSGRSGKLIVPKGNISRAEVAAIVHRLLQNSNLI